MKIVFALNVHYPTDERIYYQLVETLKAAGHKVYILSTFTDDCDLPDTKCFDSKGFSKIILIEKIKDYLLNYNPDLIICDHPIAILAANKYKRSNKTIRIVYDVTEWYPSKKNLRELPVFKQIIKTILLSLLSFYAGWLTDAFIFGEYDKAKPFRFFFFWKKYIYLSYYANLDWIKIYPQKDISGACSFLYSGPLTRDKGFDKVLKVAIKTAFNHPETKFTLTVISGTNDYPFPIDIPPNLMIEKKEIMPLPDFCKEIGKYDFFLDLRVNDFENSRCLPIKLFYYMACGRPMIYSNLKAIRRGVPEMEQMGCLVNPNNSDHICECISKYLSDSEFYKNHCEMARNWAKRKYNWAGIKDKLTHLISEL